MPIPTVAPEAVAAAQKQLDAHLLEIIQWHFSPETGCPFWLNWASKNWDPRTEIRSFADMQKFPHFQDEFLRDLQPEMWVQPPSRASPSTFLRPAAPPACQSSASAGTTTRSITPSSATKSPTHISPAVAPWLMMGPTGPGDAAPRHRAPRQCAREFLLLYRPRSALRKKLITNKQFDIAKQYMAHVVDQAVTILKHRKVSGLFTTPSCWRRWRRRSTCGMPASVACSAAARP